MAGRERDPGPGPGPGPGPAAQERAVPVRSVLLNRDSPDVESRRQRRRHRTQQVRFKDLVEGSAEGAESPPQPLPPAADPDTPCASPPPRLGPEPAAPCASAAPRGWTQAQPCTPLQSWSLSQPLLQPQLQTLSHLQPLSQPLLQPQDQPLPQSQLQPQVLPQSLLQPQLLLQPSKTRSSTAIQTSPSLQKPFVSPRTHSEGGQEAVAAAEGGPGAGVPRTPRAPCVPLPGAAGCSAAGCAPATHRSSPSAERCPRAPGCTRPHGGPPRPASVPCGRPPAAPQRLARSDSERSLRSHNPQPLCNLQPPQPLCAAPAAGAHGPLWTAQGSPHRDPPRCSSPWGGPCCTPLPPWQDSLPPAPGSATTPKTAAGPAAPGPRPTQPSLTAQQAETLRHVQDLLQLVAAANGQAAPPAGDKSARTPQGQGPVGPGERGDLRTQLQSLEGVLETSQQTIRVLLDVIQDLEKKEAQRDGRLSYRTGQDIANCGTCRDCACIIYSVEHDFRQQEGRFQRVLSSMERDSSQGSPPGAPGPQEPSPGSRLPAKLEAKKSRRKCFWFL